MDSPFRNGDLVNVLGVRIHAESMSSAVDRVILWARAPRGTPKTVYVSGVHGIMECRTSPAFREVLNSADLNVPDGMPMVWIGRLSGFKGMTRVFGPDFMLEAMKKSSGERMSHFFFGGKEGVASDLETVALTGFPGLRSAGSYTPPFRSLTESEKESIIQKINAAAPDFLWVGLSTPKQESWVREMRSSLKAGVIIAVGAAFDYNTGRLKRAPYWMQQLGLEWAYRLWQEPIRLFKRYAVNIPMFIFFALMQLCGIKKYPQVGEL